MNHPPKLGAVRTLLPPLRFMLPGVLLWVAGLAAGVVLNVMEGRGSAGALWWMKAWALVTLMWWLLMGTRLCELAMAMLSLRLPGVGRTLLRGVLVHGAITVGLPLMVLLLWQPVGVDMEALLAALWLGFAGGVLAVSLSPVLPVVPIVILAFDWNAMAQAGFSWSLGALGLLLAAGAWRWAAPRAAQSLWWTPFGASMTPAFSDKMTAVFRGRSVSRTVATPAGGQSAGADTRSTTSRDRLALVLGPECQTVRQLYGPRAPWIGYAGLAIAACVLFALGSDTTPGLFFSTVIVGGLVAVATQPMRAVASLQNTRRGVRAEVLLAPGLPGRTQLPTVLARQALATLTERLVFISVVFAAIVMAPDVLYGHWLAWLAGFTGLLLLLGLLLVLMAWQVSPRAIAWWCGVSSTVILGFGTASSVLLFKHNAPLPLGWQGAWGVLAVGIAGLLVRVYRRALPKPSPLR